MVNDDLERALAVLTLEHDLLPAERAWQLIREARAGGRPLKRTLLTEVPEPQLLAALAVELGLRYHDLHSVHQTYRIDTDTVLRADLARLVRGSALPMRDVDGNVVVAMANPTDIDTVQYLKRVFPEGVRFVLAPRAQIQSRLGYLEQSTHALPALTPIETAGTAAARVPAAAATRDPVIEWVDALLARAVAEGASDIHLTFNADESLLLRLRVDSILRQLPTPPRGREKQIVGTILARTSTMDSSNYRDPQDGTFSFTAAGRNIDARVAMLPQENGPTVVVRLLDSLNIARRLDDMGFSPTHLAAIRAQLAASQGTILVAGPTGSGKTTTLYAMLREIDSVSRAVLTVEDPVEYRLPHIGQTQIRTGLGERSLTFARALRSILRLDPDVILVGEVRDEDTARTLMDASITGHLCLSTIHAPSAVGIFLRLVEMGAPAYQVAEAVNVAINQRLVRRVHDCARLSLPTAEERVILERLGADPDTIGPVPHAMGCEACNGAGYRGRVAIAEVLVPTGALRDLVVAKRPSSQLAAAARAAGHVDLVDDALRHLRAGSSTIAELVRVLDLNPEEVARRRAALEAARAGTTTPGPDDPPHSNEVHD